MATPAPLSLPKLGDAPAGAGEEYTNALDSVIASLQNRNQINLFNVAGALLDPGRTGSFGEALGRAASSAGQDIQRQQEQAPNIAMLKAQIAGQKYEISNQADAYRLLGETLGVSTKKVTDALKSGEPDAEVANGLKQLDPKVFLAISAKSPKVASVVKDYMGQVTAQQGQDLAERRFREDQQQNLIGNLLKSQEGNVAISKYNLDVLNAGGERTKLAIAYAGLVNEIGEERAKVLTGGVPGTPLPQYMMPLNMTQMLKKPDAAAAPAAAPAAVLPGAGEQISAPMNSQLMPPVNLVPKIDSPAALASPSRSSALAPPPPPAPTPARVAAPAPVAAPVAAAPVVASSGTIFTPALSIPGYANMPFNTQKAILLDAAKAGFNVQEAAAKAGIDITKENTDAQNLEFNNRIKAIGRFSPAVNSQATNNMQTLAQIANSENGRAIFGQLQARDIDDVISRAAKAAGSILEQGVNVGHFGTANVDVTNIVSNLNLNDYQKKLAARALNAIAEETVANLSLNREAIGGRLSNYEDKQLSAAIINTNSVPEAVYYWAHKRLVQHGQESKVYDAYNKYDQSNPGLINQDPKRFFRDPKSGYEDLNKSYFQALTGLDKILMRK